MPEDILGGIIFWYELCWRISILRKNSQYFLSRISTYSFRWNSVIEEMVENKNIINFENKLFKNNNKV